ncbi:small integral membrane protein 11-like isoform X1 [Girardinichthys multiradiatus]|uniref:small integral membrane protein 11-like isoform X1 n=1 Tax=Girardinichthys multiradiatus TaxID=208333 RepID=UPI001FAB461F|nr:small integral membrane protein 11-like isoform X1 [Girardinichthys multiradiatus]
MVRMVWCAAASLFHTVSPFWDQINSPLQQTAQALDNVPLLFYILALKTLLLCLGFAGVKIYQSRKADEALKKQQAERRRLAQQSQEFINNSKED